MKTFYAFCILCVSWLATPNGSCKGHVSVYSIAEESFDATNKASRIAYVRSLLAEVERVDGVVPTLTPDEAKWLESERERIQNIKESSAHALARFSERKEKRIADLKQSIKNLRTLLNGIIDQLEDRKLAIHAWVYVGTILVDDDLTANLLALQKEGIIKVPSGMFQSPALLPKIIGKEILKKIVVENVRKLEYGQGE